VVLLVQDGRLSLDEPLAGLIPEFLDAPDTPFDRRAVTLRHVLSHCSGLPGFSPDNTELRRGHRPLEAFVASFGRQPLLFAPGTAHYYSNPGIVLAAEAVGRALAGTLGQPTDPAQVGRYHPFVHERLLAPLGMTWSSLLPPPSWDDRIAWVESTGQEGQDWEAANSRYYRSLGIPWGGLFSRPRELARFVDLFLPGAGGEPRLGSADGARIRLSRASLRAMTTVQFAPPDAPADLAPELRDSAARTPPLPAVEWGIGWTIKGTKRPHFSGELASPHTYGHLGATGTMVWADPRDDVTCVLLTNRALGTGWASGTRPRQALFSNAVVGAVR
jgi:CubicO group peptidase (beta-lactamase class C family)